MIDDIQSQNKSLVKQLCDAMYDFESSNLLATLERLLATDCNVRMGHPFGDPSGDIIGAASLYSNVYQGLFEALPDLERRDYIRIAGPSETGEQWVGCAGFYTGVFTNSWMGIRPTGHLITMRFHEFFRVENERIVEIQAVWDIPDWLRQANAWPMVPSLGCEIHVPGPATNNGIVSGHYDVMQSESTRKHIINMLTAMTRHPLEGGPEVMEMEKYWHPKMNWYGPSGIGTCRGIAGFRQWHQIPFLNAMPDRGQYPEEASFHFFADGDFAAVTGWPNMAQTITGDGWLGLAPTGQKITLRSLDFWRLENGLIRENWVLVDLLHVYDQLGIDVMTRARQMNG
ncbi:MAG: putative ester cyclase [Granulosicoccus sp.]|jgi:predicted ester cyclase